MEQNVDEVVRGLCEVVKRDYSKCFHRQIQAVKEALASHRVNVKDGNVTLNVEMERVIWGVAVEGSGGATGEKEIVRPSGGGSAGGAGRAAEGGHGHPSP